VQLVGVYLVFASLIIPALATRQIHGMLRLITGYCLGVIAYAGGLLLSTLFDLPPGAIIVWCLFVSGLITSYGISKLKSAQKQTTDTAYVHE
jgi:zinc/manganese transport system permease protein